ncbi:hypothetical protein ACQKWADRAFT_289479 [Trichoderma austrokoningii]
MRNTYLAVHSNLCINCRYLWPDKTRLSSNTPGKKRHISRSSSLGWSMVSVKTISIDKTRESRHKTGSFVVGTLQKRPPINGRCSQFAACAFLQPPLPLLRLLSSSHVYMVGIAWMLFAKYQITSGTSCAAVL